MPQLYPWQRHQCSWSRTCLSIESGLEALQHASYAKTRWQELSRAQWEPDGLRYSFHWRAARRLPGERQSWSDGTFCDGLRSLWNSGVINTRESEAFKKGNYNYRRVSLPHEFEIDITLSAPRGDTATANFVLTEEIDPDQTVQSFQHGAESVPSQLDEVRFEFENAFDSYRSRGLPSDPAQYSHAGPIRRLSPVQAKALVGETMDRCISEGWILPYERSGKFRPPGHKSPLISREAWELGHYARQSGPLYGSDQAWRTAYDLVESFLGKGVMAGSHVKDLPNAFGPLKGVKASSLTQDLPMLFGQCGFSAGPAASGGAGVFHARGQATIADLPEPYGKWLQMREQFARWNERVELEITIEARVDVHPASGDACLSLRLSTFVPTVLERLALAIGQRYGVSAATPSTASLSAAPSPGTAGSPAVSPPKTSPQGSGTLPAKSWKF